jgi:hypothetical protein
VLPGQIARFGDLFGRDLSARAVAALRHRGACDPRRQGGARDCDPLTADERLELIALRAAITDDSRMAVPADTADLSRSGPPDVLRRPARLWRPSPPPGPRRAAARHRRDVAGGPGP